MQGPTPPTKPTPPTPPSMKTSSGAPPTDTPNQATTTTTTTTTTQPATSPKPVPKVSATEQSPSTSTPTESKNNIPPLGSYSNAKETALETTTAPIMPIQKNNPVSSSITLFLAMASLIIIGTAVVLWFKNNQSKQKPTINYSTESTDDIVNLILSQESPEPAAQFSPKPPPKKLLLKPAPKPKNKGGFEVRI